MARLRASAHQGRVTPAGVADESEARLSSRADNLLCVRRRKFVVTTDSNHGRKAYPNLASGMVLSGVNQLWRADITHIRLREEFVFLAVS